MKHLLPMMGTGYDKGDRFVAVALGLHHWQHEVAGEHGKPAYGAFNLNSLEDARRR